MYTILSLLAVVIAVGLDRIAGTGLLYKKSYYVFLLIIFGMKFLVNGALTASIVFYNPEVITGFRVGTIPIEDFGFGFAMITLSVVVWERLRG